MGAGALVAAAGRGADADLRGRGSDWAAGRSGGGFGPDAVAPSEAGSSSTASKPQPPKETPNFGTSGALAAEKNTFRGVLLKYSEPPEARKPSMHYRLYVFKGSDQVDMLPVFRQSAYLFGRERLVADIPTDHPSCSKQHAVLQYRHVLAGEDRTARTVKPYIIDLESGNGTFLNGVKIDSSRYYELKVGDTVKFGFSSRDYVLMTEESAD
ncbi:SMAD/FHA domain-containing protein [Zopfochytrium polystomum]|nr:SMAD/FHA domain-containing protein [Zopfochytrium polystomum]